jgi:hypothetical protein
MTIEEMKQRISELGDKKSRIEERLKMTNESLQKQFGTTDVGELNKLLEEKTAREATLSKELEEKMTELSNILANTDV